MDGMESEIFSYFKSLLIRGFYEIRKNLDDILSLIEILMKGNLHLHHIWYRFKNAMLCET